MSQPKPDRCVGCPLYDAPGPVAGFGNTENVDIFFVGEAPGDDETKYSHKPFTGGSGRVLDVLLRSVGINRQKSFISNVVRCRSTAKNAQGKTVDRPPTKAEITHCLPFLAEELNVVKPKLVVALGSTALYVFKDTNAIGKHRGVPFLSGTQKVIATYHPAALMRQQHMFPAAYHDLSRAAKESKTATLTRHPVVYELNAVYGTHGKALLESARRSGFYCEDIETIGQGGTWKGALSPRTSQVELWGCGTEPFKAECYNWNDDVKRLVTELHLDPTLEAVGQNSENFDWVYLEGKGVPSPVGRRWDTLQMYHLVNPDLPKDLGTMGTFHTDMEYWKDEGRKPGGDKRAYNCKDVDGTTRTYLDLRKEMKSIDVETLYLENVMPVQPVLRKMTSLGFKKDEAKAMEWSIQLNMAADAEEKKLQDGLGKSGFSCNSPTQLMKLFYEEMGLPVQYINDRSKGARPTVNEEAMEKLALLTDNPIFHLVSKVRSYRKWASTYCDIDTDENGFMHPEFSTAKAGNGRMVSFNPNSQNIPNDLRELWIPDTPEHVIIAADWNQVELRNAIVHAGDENGLKLFASGQDFHIHTAAAFYAMSLGDVSDAMRHLAKFIVYGLLYGRGAKDIALQTGAPVGEVVKHISAFFKQFPQYKHSRDFDEKFAMTNNYLTNPWRRRRFWYTKQVTEMFNFRPASTAADMMYIVLPIIARQLPKEASLRLTVHDEVVVVAHRSVALEAAACIKECMNMKWPRVVEASMRPENVKKYFPGGWSIPADVTFGRSWKECKPKTKEEKVNQKSFAKELGWTS